KWRFPRAPNFGSAPYEQAHPYRRGLGRPARCGADQIAAGPRTEKVCQEQPCWQLLSPTTECKLATRLGTPNVPVTRTFALDLKAGARACLNPAGAAPLPPA